MIPLKPNFVAASDILSQRLSFLQRLRFCLQRLRFFLQRLRFFCSVRDLKPVSGISAQRLRFFAASEICIVAKKQHRQNTLP